MEQLSKIEANTEQINEMVNLLIGDELNELDEYINKVRKIFVESPDINDRDLELIIARIPIFLYRLIALGQKLEMQKGLSKEQSKYAQNEALLTATGTVAEKQATAELKSSQDRLTMLVYTTAASILSSKVEGALAIWEAAKKIQQKRLTEAKLTAQVGGSVIL